jgi:hypothetical protein
VAKFATATEMHLHATTYRQVFSGEIFGWNDAQVKKMFVIL